VEDFAAVPVGVFAALPVCPEVPLGEEAAVCVLDAEVVAGFGAGFASFVADVELSVAEALDDGGAVDEFVAGVCCAGAVPARRMVAAKTLTAMLGSFRMELVSHCFAVCANGVIREWCVLMADLGKGRARRIRSAR
jgi:hypothetical protein